MKELYPTAEEQCPSTHNYFPINSAVRRSGRLGVIIARFIIGLLHMIYCGFIFIVGTIVGIIGTLTAINVKFWNFLCDVRRKINSFSVHGWHPFKIPCWETCVRFCVH